MEDERTPKTADWEPGTLEKTRRAIGEIGAEEARLMQKKLGGEILREKAAPVTDDSLPSSYRRRHAVVVGGPARSAPSSYSQPSASEEAEPPKKKRRASPALPAINSRAASKIDKLMMSNGYEIKPNYGLFNFIRKFQRDGEERIIPAFREVTLKSFVDTLDSFITTIKTVIQISPNTYKAKIAGETDARFKFLRMVAGWKMSPMRLAFSDLDSIDRPLVVADLSAVTREIYRCVLSVYYYGPSKIPKLIKDIYTDESSYPEADLDKFSRLAKEAITSWMFIENEIVRKLYPILMRLCSDTFEEYPEFFTKKISSVLKFIGLQKFDLLLPEKQREDGAAPAARKEEAKKAEEPAKGKKDEVVDTGIALLDRLFPQAGFARLEERPDLFPYFQPLYKFGDGFSIVSPVNPLQTTIVLLRIVEDCFQGCRNINFAVDDEKGGALPSGRAKMKVDTFQEILDDWSAYRENVFEQLYCEPLKNLANSIYSQSDFESSQFGKKLKTSLLWQTTYHFLPNFKFEQLLLERPSDESKYRPLFLRVSFAREYLAKAARECDAAAKTRGIVPAVKNPWERYRFAIPNEISKRLDVLLGAKNKKADTNANNANLIKYTLCIMAVLDWWINNPESPAYSAPPMQIFRVSESDGKPVFSVPTRFDQNKLFVESVKASMKK